MQGNNYSKKMLAIALIAGLAILGAAGCGGSGKGAATAVAGGEKTYTVADPTGDWGFPSPYAHYARGPGYIRMSLIFDTLIWKDDRGHLPALARSWQYSREENAYTFILQDNVNWHDEKKFTSRDVVFTFNYIKKHPLPMVNAGAVERAEAMGDHEVKLYLNKPYAPFLDLIAASLPILPEHIWKDIGDPVRFTRREALTGTGPFTLTDYNKEQGTYLYTAYDGYYQGRSKTGRIKFVKMNSAVVAAALRNKQVNAAQVPPELSGQLGREGFKVLQGKSDFLAKLAVNHQREPMNSKEFRRALALAIDRPALVSTCLRGHGTPGSPGLVPPDNPWHNPGPSEQAIYNPDQAREILGRLGYQKSGNYLEKGGRVLELELLISGGSNIPGYPGEREGEMIRSQLEKAGIKINLRGLEQKSLDSRVGEAGFDLALLGHGGMGGDPDYLPRFVSDQWFNSANYLSNTELNEALARQKGTVDQAKRKALVDRIQELLALDLPAIPLYYPTWYWAHDGSLNLFYTIQGIGAGTPIPLNKMSFVK